MPSKMLKENITMETTTTIAKCPLGKDHKGIWGRKDNGDARVVECQVVLFLVKIYL